MKKLDKRLSLSPSDLTKYIATLADTRFIVEGLIPSNSVNIFVGNSGLGKTPFCIQLAVCVAAGVPFLGMSTQKGDVLYADFENSAEGYAETRDNICRVLSIPTPENLFRLEFPEKEDIFAEVNSFRPKLLIVDTLRYLDPTAEKGNTEAALRMKWFKTFGKTAGCATLFIHHPKKDNPEDPRPKLYDLSVPVLEWMQCASGALAFVNQSDVRLGFDVGVGGAEAVVRGHRRGAGELGPWRLTRLRDDFTGEPLAYAVQTGLDQISPKQREDFNKLPSTFGFSEAVDVLKKGRRQVFEFLHALCLVDVLKKTGEHKNTVYAKVAPRRG